MTDKLQLTKRWQDIQQLYKDMRSFQSFSALVRGEEGVGKTTLITTGRRPILIYSFDPKGTVVIESVPELRKGLEEGWIAIRPYWGDSYKDPVMYERWEKDWNEDKQSGLLENVGTVAIDSGTVFLDLLSNYIAKRFGRPNRQLAIQDYALIYAIIKKVIYETSAQNCDFIFTVHLEMEKDDITGEIISSIKTYKGLKTEIPLLFTEKYTMRKKQTPQGVKYVLLTNDQGRFKASTQIGAGGKFDIEEEPNIKNLLKKAGLPYEDKPAFWVE